MKFFLLVLLLVMPVMAQVPAIPTPPVYFSGSAGPGGKFPFFNNGSITMANADYTMQVPDFTASVIAVQGTLTASRTLYAPATRFGFEYTILNATAGNFAIVVKPEGNAAATGVTIPNGQAIMVIYNGVDYVSVGAPASVGPGGGIQSLNGNSNPAQTIAAGTGISISPNTSGTITITNTGVAGPGGGLSSINGDTTAAHVITGNTGIGITTATGTTTIQGNVINARWDCGLKGWPNDDGALLQACIDSHIGRRIFLPKVAAGIENVGNPNIDYWMNTTTIHVHGQGTTLEGEPGTKWDSGTALSWYYNTQGMQLDQSCSGCILKNLFLTGPYGGGGQGNNALPPGVQTNASQCTNLTDSVDYGGFIGGDNFGRPPLATPIHGFGAWDGIDILGAEPQLENVAVFCFNGDGIFIRGNTGAGQPDLWYMTNITAMNNRGVGFKAEGGDSNDGVLIAGNFFNNLIWGIDENSALGNVYQVPHSNSNFRLSYVAGMNKRTLTGIRRLNNVVTACFLPNATLGPTANAAGFANGNLITATIGHVKGASPDPATLSTTIPVQVTGRSVADNTACPIAGVGNGGWISWASTGPDVTRASTGGVGNLGIASNITSVSRTGGVVSVTAAASSTTLGPSDIDKIGRWVKITGTGTELDGHVFRPITVTTSGTNGTALTFRYLGPDIAAITNTGNVWSAGSADISDPNQAIRTVMDASITLNTVAPASCDLFTCSLNSRTAQFNTNIGTSNNGSGQPIRVAGAGTGGTVLSTTVKSFTASTGVVLNNPAAVTVTNVEADFGGAFGGGAYSSNTQATPSTWLNPYVELDQGLSPLRFNNNATVIGGSIPPTMIDKNDWAGTAWDTSNGVPMVFYPNNTISSGGTIQFYARGSNFPQGWNFTAGLNQIVQQSMNIYDWQSNLRHQIWLDTGTSNTFSMADNQFSFGNNVLSIRYLATPTSPASGITTAPIIKFGAALNNGAGSPVGNALEYDGQCPIAGNLYANRIFYIDPGTGNFTYSHPCVATATATFHNSPQLTFNGNYWNGSASAGSGWGIQNLVTISGTTPTKSALRIAPSAAVPAPALQTLSTVATSLDSFTFAQITAWTGVTVGTQAYCSNCVVATPASCSITTPSACVCAQGTGGAIATYENLNNGGNNWYCANPGASTTGSASGNVSTAGSPAPHQVGVWATPTTIGGISNLGTVGQVLTSNGPGVDPSFQPAGATSSAGPTFPVAVQNSAYTFTSQDFASCATKVVTTGSVAFTLPDPAPANGQCVRILYYSAAYQSVVPTSPRTINGLSTTWTLRAPPSAQSNPFGALIISDGTNYVLLRQEGAVSWANAVAGTVLNGIFTMGNGATMTYGSGTTGVVNANQINGGTIPASLSSLATDVNGRIIAGSAGGGNVSATASPQPFQIPMWQSGTTISGIASGNAGDVLTSAGAGAAPSWQPAGVSSGGPGFGPVVNLSTTVSRPVLATEFANCTTFVTTGGTPTIQLPVVTPPSGQCIWVVNYSAATPSITRLGTQLLNNQATTISVLAGSQVYPNAVRVISDGTNFIYSRVSGGLFNTIASGTLGSSAVLTVGNTASIVAPNTNTSATNGTINGTRYNATTQTLDVIGANGGPGNVIASGTITADVSMVAPQFTVNPSPPPPNSPFAQTRTLTTTRNAEHNSAFRILSPNNNHYLDINVPDSGDPSIQSSTGTVTVSGLGGGPGGGITNWTGLSGNGGVITNPSATTYGVGNWSYLAPQAGSTTSRIVANYLTSAGNAGVAIPTLATGCLQYAAPNLSWGPCGGGAGTTLPWSSLRDATAPNNFFTNGYTTEVYHNPISGASFMSVYEDSPPNPPYPPAAPMIYLESYHDEVWPLVASTSQATFRIGGDGNVYLQGSGPNNGNFIGQMRPYDPVTSNSILNAPALGTDTNGNIVPKTGAGGPVYDKHFSGIEMLGTGTTTITNGTVGLPECDNFGNCTMLSPTSDGTYRVELLVIQTTPGSSGCSAGTGAVHLAYTDGDSGATINWQPLIMKPMNSGSMSLTFALTTAANGAATTFQSFPTTIHVRGMGNSGTPIRYRIYQQAASTGCSGNQPTYSVRIAIFGPLGY